MNRIANMNEDNQRASEAPVSRSLQTGTVGIAASLVLVAVILSSCATQNPPIPEQAIAPSAVTLVSGDVIKLTFAGAPELNQTQKIRTDGKVNLPLIGEVDASGKTIPSLQ